MTARLDADRCHKAIVTLTEANIADGASDLRWQLHDLMLDGVRTIVVDVSQVDRLPSTVLAALLATHRACRAQGGGVVIRYPGRAARALLRRTGLDHVFAVDQPTSQR